MATVETDFSVKVELESVTMEEKGLITNVQDYSVHDGYGLRLLVFLKGCPLRCKWCQNPETIYPFREIEYHGYRLLSGFYPILVVFGVYFLFLPAKIHLKNLKFRCFFFSSFLNI